jgi:hypothetical protein
MAQHVDNERAIMGLAPLAPPAKHQQRQRGHGYRRQLAAKPFCLIVCWKNGGTGARKKISIWEEASASDRRQACVAWRYLAATYRLSLARAYVTLYPK